MKRKFPLFMAMLLAATMLCNSVAFAAPSPGRDEIEIDEIDIPLVELPTTAVEAETTIDEAGAAVVSVPASDLLAAVQTVISEGTMRISITAAGTEGAGQVTAVLPTQALQAIVEQTSAELQVDTAAGQVTLPSTLLASIVETAAGEDVHVSVTAQTAAQGLSMLDGKVDVDAALVEAGAVIEVSITSGDSVVTTWNGDSVTLALPVSGDFQEGMSYTVYQVDASGNVRVLVGQCVLVDGQLRIVFSVNSLGTFVVLPDTVVGNTVAAAPAMVASPLAASVVPAEVPTLFTAVQQWLDAAVMQLFRL